MHLGHAAHERDAHCVLDSLAGGTGRLVLLRLRRLVLVGRAGRDAGVEHALAKVEHHAWIRREPTKDERPTIVGGMADTA